MSSAPIETEQESPGPKMIRSLRIGLAGLLLPGDILRWQLLLARQDRKNGYPVYLSQCDNPATLDEQQDQIDGTQSKTY